MSLLIVRKVMQHSQSVVIGFSLLLAIVGAESALAETTKITAEPFKLAPGSPLSRLALVTHPATLSGVVSWTIESLRHRGRLYDVDASPDGKQLATGGLDGTVRIWDLETGKLRRILVGHDDVVSSVSWSPDGAVIASAGTFDGTVRLWAADSGRLLRTLTGCPKPVTHVAWSPDGAKLACAGGESGWVGTWEPRVKNMVKARELGRKIEAISWAPDSERIAACMNQQPAEIITTSFHKVLGTVGQQPEECRCLAWSPDGKTLAIGTMTGADLWDVSQDLAKATRVKRIEGRADWAAWSADSRQLATAAERPGIQLWDVASNSRSARFQFEAKRVCWHRGTGQIIGMSAVALGIWKVGQAQPSVSIDAAGQISPSWTRERPIVSGLGTPKLTLWDPSTVKPLSTLQGPESAVNTVAWSHDGKFLAAAGADNAVRLWDPRSGELFQTLKGHTDAVTQMAWAPSVNTLATAGADKTVRLWDSNGHSLATLEGHKGNVRALAWSRPGNVLASGSYDRSIRVWNPKTQKVVCTIDAQRPVLSLECAQRNVSVACGADGASVRVFNASSGQLTFKPAKSGSASAVALSWLPNGMLLAGGGHTFQLWDLGADRVVHFDVYATIEHLAYTANGAVVVSTTDDRTLRFWDAANTKLRGAIVLERGHLAMVSADGNWQASPTESLDSVVVVATAEGQQFVPPDEFADRFHWKNNPAKIKFTAH